MKKHIKPIIFYIILFLFILAFSMQATDYDYDFWARLIAGMGFVQTGHVLKHDFLSYTPTHTWFDHEWGSGVIFYLTQHIFSSAGIILLQALLVFLIFFVISKVIKLRSVKTTSPYNFLFYYFAYSSMSALINDPIRCQLFSFLFFAAFIYILELSRKTETKLIYTLPFLMIIWNNLHGGCVAGIGLIAMYIVGEFLNKKPVKKYIYALIPTVLVLVINPWGFSYLGFLFKATTMARNDVSEWWNLFCPFFMFKYMKFKIFALVLLLFEAGLLIKQFISKTLEIDKTKIIVLFATIFLAVQHAKLVPLAVISMTCFLYDDFYTFFNYITRNVFNKIANVKDTIIYLLILLFAITNINAKGFQPLQSGTMYPVASVEFIRLNELKGNLLIAFGQGSYASYKLYPNIKIFMDGRYEEVYYDYMMLLLHKFYMGQKGWDEVLKKFPPDIMVIEKFYPVYGILQKDKNWTIVYNDKFFVVFVKTKDARKSYKIPSQKLDYYRKTLFDTNINFMLQSKHEKK